MSRIDPHTVRLRDGREAIIRSASHADAERLNRLKRDVVAEGCWTLAQVDELCLTTADQVREIARYERDSTSTYLVACVGSGVVGTARVEGGSFQRTGHAAELHSLWVDAAYRRLGIADALVETILDWARASKDLEKLWVLAFSTTGSVLSLYEKYGFVVEGRGVRDIKFGDGSYADTVVLGYFLAPAR